MANIFHIDFPTGNISLKESAALTRNRLIKSAIPVSLGDSYNGFRIVGTTPAYLELYESEFATGSWKTGEMNAIIGAEVRSKLNLNLDDLVRWSTNRDGETGKAVCQWLCGVIAQPPLRAWNM